MHAAFALAEMGDPPQEFLLDSVPTAAAGECRNLVAALERVKESALPQLALRAQSAEDLHAKARFAIVALQLGETGAARQALAVRGDPSQRTALIHDFAGWHGDVADLAELLKASDDPAFRSGLCAALGTIDPPHDEREKAVQTLTDFYTSAADGGTHSAAGWALRQWEENLPALPTRSHPQSDRDWFVNGRGMTMIKVPAGSLSTVDLAVPNSPSFAARLTKPFYVCDREVWADLFREFVDDASGDEVPLHWNAAWFTQAGRGGDVPVQMVNWFNAVRFCNWLSRREGRRPCYRRAPDRAADENAGSSLENWQWDRNADGYRLPTEAEWEYACRAGATTTFCFGDEPTLLASYGVYVVNAEGQPRPGALKLPNAWGLFDLHGNVNEWCYDWHAPYPADAVDPSGPAEGTERICRGGSYFSQSGRECDARIRWKAIPHSTVPYFG
ncbi:MAG: formylglycine-generating enzyme family protein, partial [Pirellulales bacterium]